MTTSSVCQYHLPLSVVRSVLPAGNLTLIAHDIDISDTSSSAVYIDFIGEAGNFRIVITRVSASVVKIEASNGVSETEQIPTVGGSTISLRISNEGGLTILIGAVIVKSIQSEISWQNFHTLASNACLTARIEKDIPAWTYQLDRDGKKGFRLSVFHCAQNPPDLAILERNRMAISLEKYEQGRNPYGSWTVASFGEPEFPELFLSFTGVMIRIPLSGIEAGLEFDGFAFKNARSIYDGKIKQRSAKVELSAIKETEVGVTSHAISPRSQFSGQQVFLSAAISNWLAQVSESPLERTLNFDISEDVICQVNATTLNAMADFLVHLQRCEEGASPHTSLGILTWASLLLEPTASRNLATAFPSLHRLLSAYTCHFGQDTTSMRGALSDELRNKFEEFKSEVVPGGKPQDLVSALIRISRESLSGWPASVISREASLLSVEDRVWFISGLMAHPDSPNDPRWIMEHINRADLDRIELLALDTWRSSSLSGICAVLSDIDVALGLLDGLSQKTGLKSDHINWRSMYYLVHCVFQHGQAQEIQAFVAEKLYEILAKFGNGHYSPFRNAAVILAFRRICKASRLWPKADRNHLAIRLAKLYCDTDELSSFQLDDEFKPTGREAPCRGAGVALQLEDQVGEKPSKYSLTSLGLEEFNDKLEERSGYFKRRASLEKWKGSEITAFANFDSPEMAVRSLALPEKHGRLSDHDGRGAAYVREYLDGLQPYTKSPNQAALSRVGMAALEMNHAMILDSFRNRHAVQERTERLAVFDIALWSTFVSSEGTKLCKMELLELLLTEIHSASADELSSASLLRCVARFWQSGLLLNNESAAERFSARLGDHWRNILQFDCAPTRSDPSTFFSDTAIAVITCKKNLDTRVSDCMATWVRTAVSAGCHVFFFYGDEPHCSVTEIEPGVTIVGLPVGDGYEDLPTKVLEMNRWLHGQAGFWYFIKVDDDCYIDVKRYITSLGYRVSNYFGRPLVASGRNFNRTWHSSRVGFNPSRESYDLSLSETRYADGGGAYSISLMAQNSLIRASTTPFGRRLRSVSFYEDKYVGDLLQHAGYELRDTGYSTVQSRRNFPDAVPVLQIDRGFYPSAYSGTLVAHLDGARINATIQASYSEPVLRPARLFPLDKPLSIDAGSNMLELLSSILSLDLLDGDGCVCVSVVRNERKIMKHFLDHYRSLGLRRFVLIDNLSDDGTREFLLEQKDVIVFSAASDYKSSHYGVDWVRVVLDHYCVDKWVLVADADEFLVLPSDACNDIDGVCNDLQVAGIDGSLVLMVDMYPQGVLSEANFDHVSPLEICVGFDGPAVRRWPFNSGPFGDGLNFVSGLRHRLLPKSPPEAYTAQKVALFRFNPRMSFSEGFHFASGVTISRRPLAFLHFKYGSDFFDKAENEVLRQQHYDGAKEYVLYSELARDNLASFWCKDCSRNVADAQGCLLKYVLTGVIDESGELIER